MSDQPEKIETNEVPTPEKRLIDSPLLNVDECAEFLRCKPCTVRQLVRDGKLPYLLIGGRFLFRKAGVEQWLEDSERKNPARFERSNKLKVGHNSATRTRKSLKKKAS